MRDWTIDLFTTYGAQIEAGPGGDLIVDLPPDMAAHFGQERLYLTFSSERMSLYEDVVTFGSRVFDQMVSWLAGRGTRTALYLPSRTPEGLDPEALPPGMTLHNVTATVRSRAVRRVLARFDLRLTATADERRDELLAVVLDETGRLYPALAAEAMDGPIWETGTLPLPQETCERLSRLAVDAARARAAEMGAALQEQGRARVQAALLRVAAYYRQRIAELDPEDENTPERAAQLERESQRRQAEELARCRVRVTIAPVSWALISVPFQEYHLDLRRPAGVSLDLEVDYDLWQAQVHPETCHACGQEVTRLGLCDHRHVACPDCLHTCVVCGHDVCVACGIVEEHMGGGWVCADCAVICAGCGRPTLPAHIERCVTCGRSFCQTCLQTCAQCGRPFCAEHVVACALCGGPRCADHYQTCHICHRPACEAHYASCSICEQVSCSDHTSTCPLCGQQVCTACRGTAGLCQTCLALMDGGSWATPPPPVPWAGLYNWRQGSNARWVVYYGRHKGWPWNVWAVVVTDLAGKVRYEARPGPIEALRRRPK